MSRWLFVALLWPTAPAFADQLLTLDSTVARGGLDHERVFFEVPAGIAELQVDHDDRSADDILDWGLEDPAGGFRGWGGGNTEPAIVNALAASRSYLPGPITPGRWAVIVGKAKILGASRSYRLRVTLREVATLAPQAERTPYVPVAALKTERRWYAGDLHVHSRESGDASPTLDEIADFARSRGLDFVAISDHNTTAQLDYLVAAQARHPDVLFLPSVEWTTYGGHANGIGATRWVDHKIGQPGVTAEAAATAFLDQGALFSINHPAFDLGELCIGCAWTHAVPRSSVYAVEIATAGAGPLFSAQTLAFWDRLCDDGNCGAAVGGSDDHSAGERIGPFGAPIGTPTTYVLADELSAAAIIAGIRAQQTVVKVLGPTDPMVELSSTRLPLDEESCYDHQLVAKVTGASGLGFRWVVDGVADRELPIDSDVFEARRTSERAHWRYRGEVLRSGIPTTISSHVVALGGCVDTEPDSTGCACEAVRDGDAAVALSVLILLVARARRRSWSDTALR